MSPLLQYAKASGLFNSIDYHFAKTIGQHNPKLELLALIISHAYGMKHTMIPFDYLYNPHDWWASTDPALIHDVGNTLLSLADIQSPEDWQPLFHDLRHTSVSPISITANGLYLTKNLNYEKNIVQFLLNTQAKDVDHPSQVTINLLQTLFPNEIPINKQKLAATNALLSPVSIISGGPGTGKTTTVIKILLLLLNEHPNLHISLAAPTGKAAARLSESIEKQKSQFQITHPELQHLLEKIPNHSTTLHRLLKFNPTQTSPTFHPYHPLPTDLIIIDEASMIDLHIFNLLIQALPKKIRVIILGDKDQLASVEAGAIMGEICQNIGYSASRLQSLSDIMQQSLLQAFEPMNTPLNNVTLLTQSHRFSEDSGIGQLAQVVNNQHASSFLRTIEKFPNELSFMNAQNNVWLTNIDALLKPYLELCQSSASPQELFAALHTIRILCATNVSEYGTQSINQYISEHLFKQIDGQLYHGQAIMILQNDYINGIYNGDIGILVREDDRIIAYFEADNGLRSIPVQLLPRYETAFAMTIHKSQGSEFNHVMIILPEFSNKVLTKELLYTGITRAKQQLTIIGTPTIIEQTIRRKTERFSGIGAQLNAACALSNQA